MTELQAEAAELVQFLDGLGRVIIINAAKVTKTIRPGREVRITLLPDGRTLTMDPCDG